MGGIVRLKIVLLVLATLVPALSQEARVQLDPNSTKVNFTLGDVLHTVHGTFKLKSGDVWFDATTGKAGGQLVIDAASGQSGSGARDSRMHKNILESSKYPVITFVPDRVDGTVNMAGDSDLKLHGLFGIHGGTHELAMKVKTHIEGDQLKAAVDFAVPYVQWGMKNPSTLFLKVNDTVQIDMQVSAHIINAPHAGT
jgi:polyisoprenoid-binding protein YceI